MVVLIDFIFIFFNLTLASSCSIFVVLRIVRMFAETSRVKPLVDEFDGINNALIVPRK